jgi:PAS domain S-box-containing protein
VLADATRLSRWSAVLAGVAAGGLGIAALTGLVPDPHVRIKIAGPVRPEAATALLAAGLSLILLAGRPGKLRRRIGYALGAATAAIAGVGLLQHALPAGGRLPYAWPSLSRSGEPTPIAAASAVTLLLAGLALAMLDADRPRRVPWPHALAPAAAAMAMISGLANLFEVSRAVPSVAGLVAMPAPTAIGVLILSAGTLLARPAGGALRPFGSTGPGGAFARRLTPTLVLVPFGTVLLSVVMIKLGGQPPLALSLSAGLFVLIAALLLGSTVRAVDAADARRERLLDELAAERDFTGTLLQSLSEGVVVLDRDLRVIDVNPRACQLLGQRRDRLVGQAPPYSWQPEGEPNTLVYGDSGVETGGAADRRVRRPDGQLVPVLARMSPVLDPAGRPRAFVGTFVDITGRKQAEEALAAHADDLERANDRLRHTNLQLEQAAEFKSDLMSIVSHEVSQPLSSVASLAELLAEDWIDLPDDVRLELAGKIDKNARRLTGMINDMLLLFRLDAGAVSARRGSVPVGEVVETVADSLPATAQIVSSIDPELCVLVDRGHLWQVLSNLVNNALTYGQPPIEIGAEPRPDGVVISIRDHGPGIPEEDVPKLFDRIARRPSGGNRPKGSGLGLFIVRHLVEVNGGTVWYEPARPEGATLKVRMQPAPLPAAKTPAMS